MLKRSWFTSNQELESTLIKNWSEDQNINLSEKNIEHAGGINEKHR